jgi:hypothetical protein
MGAKKFSTILMENLTKHGRLFPKGSVKENEGAIRDTGFTTPEEVIQWANLRHYTMKSYSGILFNYFEQYSTSVLKEIVLELFIARSAYYSIVLKIFEDGPITTSLSIESIKKLLDIDGGFPENIPILALIAKNSEILNMRIFDVDEIIDLNCYLLFKKDDMAVQIANRRNYLIVRDAIRAKEK